MTPNNQIYIYTGLACAKPPQPQLYKILPGTMILDQVSADSTMSGGSYILDFA